MTIVVTIKLVEASPASTATAYVNDREVAWATEIRPERAVRECMKLTRAVVEGELRFALPFCGKRFHVPWWEKRGRISLRDAARLRKRGLVEAVT